MALVRAQLISSRKIYVVDFNTYRLEGRPYETPEEALAHIEELEEVGGNYGVVYLIGSYYSSEVKPIKHRKRN